MTKSLDSRYIIHFLQKKAQAKSAPVVGVELVCPYCSRFYAKEDAFYAHVTRNHYYDQVQKLGLEEESDIARYRDLFVEQAMHTARILSSQKREENKSAARPSSATTGSTPDLNRPSLKAKGPSTREGEPPPTSQRNSPKPHAGVMEIPLPADARYPDLLLRPDSRPISQEQLAAEVKSIYAGLTMVESKCIPFDKAQAAAFMGNDSGERSAVTPDYWQAQTALHRTLLHEHHDFFLASQHPSASPSLRRLAAKYATKYPMASQHPGRSKPGLRPHYVVEGTLNDVAVSALPDSGSEKNVLSLAFVQAHNLRIKRHTKSLSFRLPSGDIARSVGTVRLPWRFADESKITYHDFSVLPACIHDVILGEPFLNFTNTLSSFMHRIKAKFLPIPPVLGVKLIGSQKRRVFGSLNGQSVSAVADTGSDVLLMSKGYATSRGFKIHSGVENQILLQFADGSRKRTSGLVKDIGWSFGHVDGSQGYEMHLEFPNATAAFDNTDLDSDLDIDGDWTVDASGTRYRCNFHIMDGLPVDLVLNNELLFHSQAFSKYQQYFYNSSMGSIGENDELYELSLVRKLKDFRERIRRHRGRSLHEASIPSASELSEERGEFVRRELQRRDEIEDTLPTNQQSPAWQAENRLRFEWTVELQRRDNAQVAISARPTNEQAAAWHAEQIRREVWNLQRVANPPSVALL